MAQAPNIILITTDQQRGDCYGFEGRRVKTPHLDRMARDGLCLPNTFTPSIVCQPARAAILTGMLPLTTGACDNGMELEDSFAQQGFAARLSRAGYRTALIGKAHLSSKLTFQPTGQPECHVSSADYGPDWHGPYRGFDHVELMTFGHLHQSKPPSQPPHGQHFERWFWHVAGTQGAASELHRKDLGPPSGVPQTWNSALPAAWHPNAWVTDRAIDLLRDHDRRQPFLAWVSYPDPHHPFDASEPWSRLHLPGAVDLPKHRTRDLDRRPWWHRAALEGTPEIADETLKAFRKGNFAMPQLSDAQLATMIANYYGMIAHVDHEVGRLLAWLEVNGLRENTYIVFTSDHGDFLGDHGLTLKGPMAYDGVLRVNMIVNGPGVGAGQRRDTVVSTLDLAETFYELAGIAGQDGAQGRSLAPLFLGRPDDRDQRAYSEWHISAARFGAEVDLRTVRTPDMKLSVEMTSGDGEMYDLARDPEEMNNVFQDPGYATARREMEARLAARPGPLRSPLPAPSGIA
jgi:arylsulfatase A-like enzyme